LGEYFKLGHARIAQARARLQSQSPKIRHTPKVAPAVSTALPVCPHCHQPGLVLLWVTRALKHSLPRYAELVAESLAGNHWCPKQDLKKGEKGLRL
jgi:hypothetical protein